jgi:hypothetical protein
LSWSWRSVEQGRKNGKERRRVGAMKGGRLKRTVCFFASSTRRSSPVLALLLTFSSARTFRGPCSKKQQRPKVSFSLIAERKRTAHLVVVTSTGSEEYCESDEEESARYDEGVCRCKETRQLSCRTSAEGISSRQLKLSGVMGIMVGSCRRRTRCQRVQKARKKANEKSSVRRG